MKPIIYYDGKIHANLGYRMVGRRDIDHLAARPTSMAQLAGKALVPYCFDYAANSILFATGVNARAAAHAEFHYDYLRRHADGFVEIPLERLSLSAKIPAQPVVLLFSPGRCGSTLLAKVVDAMGLRSITEPDFYSQAAFWAVRDKPRNTGLTAAEAALLRIASQFLMAALPAAPTPLLLKLRSHANWAPATLVDSFVQKPRSIFLLRPFLAWCESRAGVFGNSLEDNLMVYVLGLNALAWLQDHTDCLVLNYAEMSAESDAWVKRLALFLDAPGHLPALATLLAKDSQAGTFLARDKRRALAPGAREAIARRWQADAPRALIDRLGLAGRL